MYHYYHGLIEEQSAGAVQSASARLDATSGGTSTARSRQTTSANLSGLSAITATAVVPTSIQYASATLSAFSGPSGIIDFNPDFGSDFNPAGGAVANVRALAGTLLTGSGAIVTSQINQFWQTRAAFQGTSTEFADGAFFRTGADLAAASALTATVSLVAAFPTAPLNATSNLAIAPGTIVHATPRVYFLPESFLRANGRVRKAKHTRAGIAAGSEPAIIALELETFVPGQAAVPATKAHGTKAHGTLSRAGIPSPELTAIITASDIGYRSRSTDAAGTVSYPPLLTDAFQIDARLSLQPDATAAAAAWGSLVLSNPNGQFDALIGVQNSDGRPLKLLTGRKTFDVDRQYFTDPAYTALATMFSGLATPWALNDSGLTVPLRDATYWLEKPLQNSLYGGTGGLEGTSDLTGKPKPKARGGTTGNPINNITPTLIDATNRIYQYNDGPGTVVTVYEGGAPVITRQGDVADLYSASTSAGFYRTNNAKGLFQLGSVPVAQITADVTGAFPIAGDQANPFLLAKYMLTEDCTLPLSMVATTDFDAAALTYNYTAGVYFGSDQIWSAVQGLEAVLMGLGANLIPLRNGTLSVFLLHDIAATEPIVASFDVSLISSMQRTALPTQLDPPPFRIRAGYNHNYTIQTSGLNTASSTADHRQFIASGDRFASWADASLVAAYRRPNDYTAFPTALLSQAHAQAVVNSHGAMWGVARRLYAVTVPASRFGVDLGKVVRLSYPIERLADGQSGRVVGFSYRSGDASVIYTVLV